MINNKKIFLIVVVIIMISIVSGMYIYLYLIIEQKTLSEPIKVAKSYWPGEFWVEIADSKGWFRESGLNVEFVDVNENYYGSLIDTIDGKLDINNFDLYDLINFNLNGSDLVLIINLDTSFGGEAIVAKSFINNTFDLINKTVGMKKYSYNEYIFDAVMDRDELNKDKINKIDIQDEKILDYFDNGTIDAFITWSPLTDDGVKNGGHIIFDTSEIKGISTGGHAVRRDFLNKRPKDLQKFVNVWYKTTEYIKNNQDEAFNIIANRNNITIEDVITLAKKDMILDLDENIISFTYAPGVESLHGAFKKINNFMQEKNLTIKEIDSSDFIDSRFIRKIKEDNQ